MTQLDELHDLEAALGPRLRATFDACLADERTTAITPVADRSERNASRFAGQDPLRTVEQRRRHRVLLAVAAAAAVAVGVAGIALVARPAPDLAPATSAEAAAEPDVSAGTDAAETGPAAPTDDVDAVDLGIALPTFVPDGYVLDHISVNRMWSPFVWPERSVFVRRTDGAIDAMLTVASQPLTPEFDTAKGATTVHGAPAQIYDSGEGIRVTWAEHDHIVAVTGLGVSWDDANALAEQTVVDPATGAVDLPTGTGFERVAPASTPPADAAATTITLRAVADAADQIGITRWPNTDGDPLEVSAFRWSGRGMPVEPATVRDHDAIVLTFHGDTSMRGVQWIDGDGTWSVTGRQPVETLLAIAEGLTPATLDEARAVRAQLDADLATLPELDRAVLGDTGIEVSIHTLGTGADVVCLRRPVQRCERWVSESTLVGERQSAVARETWVGDAPWLIGWAEGTHDPALFDPDGTRTGAGERIADVVAGSAVVVGTSGTFVAVPSPADDFQFSFDAGEHPAFGGGWGRPSTDPELLH